MFIACGINHQTAPIHLREQLALQDSQRIDFLKHLISLPNMNEVAVLSTCNRTELYCDLQEQQPLIHIIAQHTHVPLSVLTQHWYTHFEQEGVKHALRVASGLDSRMLGEPQIFGWFKQAYAEACETGTAKSSLKNIFPFVFRASKRIRNESGIHKHAISVASAAAAQILQTFKSHHTLQVLIIGTGEMAQLVTKYLHDAGVQHFLIASRTEEHAQQLASLYKAKPINILNFTQYLPQMDVIITATACPIPFITKEMVKTALEIRNDQPLFFLDLALPRDVCENVAQLSQVTLCNIDDLQAQCQANLTERQHAALIAETLVEDELSHYIRWSQIEASQHLISNYRTQMHELAKQELTRALQHIENTSLDAQILQKLTHRLFKKLTHLPTITLRQAALEGRTDLLEFAQSLLTEASTASTYEIID